MDMFSSEITKQLVSWIVILITRVVQSKRMFFSSQLWSVLLVSDFQFSLATFKFIQICSRARFGFSCLQRTEWPCLNGDLIIVRGSRIFVFKMDRVLVENSFKEINTKWFKAKKIINFLNWILPRSANVSLRDTTGWKCYLLKEIA